MGRPFSDKFLRELHASKSEGLGVQLAKICVKSNVPAAYVAVALEVSRITVYNWFRGGGIREDKIRTVSTLIDLMNEDFDNGVLPVADNNTAKQYIENLAGVRIGD